MDAYEGKTVRLEQQCPLCRGPMEEGFVLDYTQVGPRRTEWVAGTPKRSVWGGMSLKNTRRYTVESFRCTQCGFLTSYATARTDKG